MVSTRFLGLVSTVLLVVGALVFGEALHRTVVTGEAPLTSPLMVVYFGVGAAFIVLGYRVRQPVGRRYGLGSDDERERAERSGSGPEPGPGSRPASGAGGDRGDGEGFDPSMSPLGDAAPGDARESVDEADTDERGGGTGGEGGSRRERAEGDDSS